MGLGNLCEEAIRITAEMKNLKLLAQMLLLILCFLGLRKLRGISEYWWIYIIVFLSIFILLYVYREIIYKYETITFLGYSIFTIIILRAIWIFMVPTIPFDDFAYYNNLAISVSHRTSYQIFNIDYSSKGILYAFILGILYKIFGYHLIFAKSLNIILSIMTAIFIYLIAKKIFNEQSARISVIIFAFLPSQIMYSSVLSSENMYVVLLLMAFYLILSSNSNKLFFLSGIIMGLSNLVRLTSTVMAVVSFIFLIIHKKHRQTMGFILGFIFVMLLISSMIYLLKIKSDPQYGGEISFMFGTNYDSIGGWNPEDANLWFSTNTTQRKSMAVRTGIHRITDNPLRFIKLIVKKFDKLWSDEIYGISWSTEQMDKTPESLIVEKSRKILYSISQTYYIFILFLTMLTCYSLRNMKNEGVNLFLMTFLIFVVIHSFLEVQSRYHYTVEIFFIILSGYFYGSNRSPQY